MRTMRRHSLLLFNTIRLLANDCLGVLPSSAGLQALEPRVIKFCVTGASTISKPGTAPTTATAHAGFLRDAAYGACRTDARRRGYYTRAPIKCINKTLLSRSFMFVGKSVCTQAVLDLRSQAAMPSDHV